MLVLMNSRPRLKLGHQDFFLYPFYLFPYSCLTSNLLCFLCLISFMLFPCTSIWENTSAFLISYCHAKWYRKPSTQTSITEVKLFVTIAKLARGQTSITAVKICPAGENSGCGKNLFLQV